MIDLRAVLVALATTPFADPAAAQEKLPLLAILSPSGRNSPSLKLIHEPFKQALGKLGYEPGRTIEIAERYADSDVSRLPALAAELVALQPRVLFTDTAPAAVAAARATRSIPIVVGATNEATLVELAGGTMARPSTNVTGFSVTSVEMDIKCLALLIEATPAAKRIGVLIHPGFPATRDYPAVLKPALGASGAVLIRLESSGLADIDAALAKAAAEQVDSLYVYNNPQNAGDPDARQRVLLFAAAAGIPVASTHQDFARDGALLAMGPSFAAVAVGAAGYVDKILRGAKPADLPVQRPSVFTTIINLKTANALGLAIPPLLLARADEVIE